MIACLLLIALCVFSYLFTCGLIYLVTLCFGWSFSWLVATGIWLVMILLRTVFNK